MIGAELLGRYRIIRRLGVGSMGEVFLAEHATLKRPEALKVVRPELSSSPEFVACFRREARATNRLQHVNIVTLYDFGRLPDGRLYLSMEYAHGDDLAAMVRRDGVLAPARVVEILGQVADAIEHAHRRGVIHRDLKPANLVVLEREGRRSAVKVLDFGLAKICTRDSGDSQRNSTDGMVCGTPQYMAPEQFVGTDDDPRIDIYALGCIAYELLVGRPPFDGALLSLYQKHMSEVPARPSKARPDADISAGLERLVLACLEKDPGLRPQTGRELRLKLEELAARADRGAGPRVSPLGGAPVSGGDEPELDTDRELDTQLAAIRSAGEPADVERWQAFYRHALLSTAEAMLDAGAQDGPLLLAVLRFNELVGQNEALEAEQGELVARLEWAAERLRARAAGLRFSGGVLQFALGGPLAGQPEDLAAQAAVLEGRLVEVVAEHDRLVAHITDRQLTLASQLAAGQAELGALVQSLEAQVSRLIGEFYELDAVRSLYDESRRARHEIRLRGGS